jgi:hemolysin III
MKLPAAAAFPFYSIGEEIANSVTHGLGALASVAGLVLLSLKASGSLAGQGAGGFGAASAVLFAATMIGMFLISTVYHAVQNQGAKQILRKLDHSMIYIFIAGTYTPFCLIGLKGAWGWSILAVEWALAVAGIAFNILGAKKLKKASVAAYILMGWVIIVGIVPMIRTVPAVSIILLLSGGVMYTLGTIWYRMKTVKHTHAVWHSFVILGALCHWFSVWHMV